MSLPKGSEVFVVDVLGKRESWKKKIQDDGAELGPGLGIGIGSLVTRRAQKGTLHCVLCLSSSLLKLYYRKHRILILTRTTFLIEVGILAFELLYPTISQLFHPRHTMASLWLLALLIVVPIILFIGKCVCFLYVHF